MKTITTNLICCLVCLGVSIQAQDAQEILRMMHEKQQERWKGVNNYTVTLAIQDAMGMETSIYHEKIQLDGQIAFKEVPRHLYEREMYIQAGFPPPEKTAAALAKGYRSLATSGAPNYGMDFNEMADFLDAGADAFANTSDGTAEAKDEVSDMKEFMRRAKLVGTEMVRAGTNDEMKEAYHFKASNLEDVPMDQHPGGGKFTLETVSLFIEKQQLVPLALIMKGNVDNKGEKTPINIEKYELDHKQVGSLYEPHTTIYSIKGIMQAMSKKEQKQMEQAKAQFENMTEQEKEMMERMMPGKFEQLMGMMEGESYESVVTVSSIAINEGPPSAYGMGQLGESGALTIAAEMEDENGNLVAELSISSGSGNPQALQVSLIGQFPYPLDAGDYVPVVDARGDIIKNGKNVSVEGGSGQITITDRTATRIKGTYDATLELFENGVLHIYGAFDSGAPIGPGQAPRGSPIPAGLFSTQD
jgi:hypothetical protein